jgi:nicotinamidase-related amidase
VTVLQRHLLRKEETQVVRWQQEKFAHLVNSAPPRKASRSSCEFKSREQIFMSVSSTDKGLLTPDNCAVIFIDFQPQMFSGVANMDRQDLLNNVRVLAKAAKIFGVPVILTAVESKEFSGKIAPQLLDLFPGQTPIERSSMNSWESKEFVTAVKKTGRKNFLIAALWMEACLVFPALQMLEDGYGVYAVEDASGGASKTAHDAAIRRIEQAGAVSLTALQVLLEFQRDWARTEHYDEVLAVVKEHWSAYGQGVEYADTLVHKAPVGRRHREEAIQGLGKAVAGQPPAKNESLKTP